MRVELADGVGFADLLHDCPLDEANPCATAPNLSPLGLTLSKRLAAATMFSNGVWK
jgi:hypothetical protein